MQAQHSSHFWCCREPKRSRRHAPKKPQSRETKLTAPRALRLLLLLHFRRRAGGHLAGLLLLLLDGLRGGELGCALATLRVVVCGLRRWDGCVGGGVVLAEGAEQAAVTKGARQTERRPDEIGMRIILTVDFFSSGGWSESLSSPLLPLPLASSSVIGGGGVGVIGPGVGAQLQRWGINATSCSLLTAEVAGLRLQLAAGCRCVKPSSTPTHRSQPRRSNRLDPAGAAHPHPRPHPPPPPRCCHHPRQTTWPSGAGRTRPLLGGERVWRELRAAMSCVAGGALVLCAVDSCPVLASWERAGGSLLASGHRCCCCC